MTGGVGARTVCIIAALCCCINRCWGYQRADQVKYRSNYNVLLVPREMEFSFSCVKFCMGSYVKEEMIVTSAACLGKNSSFLFHLAAFQLQLLTPNGETTNVHFRGFRRWANLSLPRFTPRGDYIAVHPGFVSHDDYAKRDIAVIGGWNFPEVASTGHRIVQLPPEDVVQSKGPQVGSRDCYFSGSLTQMRSDWVVPVRIVEFSVCSREFNMMAVDDKICVRPIGSVPDYMPILGRGLVCKDTQGHDYLGGVEWRGFLPDSPVKVAVFTKTAFMFQE